MFNLLRINTRQCISVLFGAALVLLLSACGGVPEEEDTQAPANVATEEETYFDTFGKKGKTPKPPPPDTGGAGSAVVNNALAEANGVIVKFRNGVSASVQQSALGGAGCSQTASFNNIGNFAHATFNSNTQTLQQTINTLNLNSAVEYAEPNYILSVGATPNDPRFGSQYALHNNGQTGGVVDADIDAPEAWDIQTGSSNVVVAVIDSGVDFNHPDLRNNIWQNTREVAGNGVDDDGNGFVDDIRGWDFANNDNNPMDDNGHGTHVAGTIAAQGNNGVGVSGVVWRARIMPLKFITAAGGGTTLNAIRAINYAVANGARISNNSWGGGGFSQALYDAISAANTAGHLFVAAAGNASINTDTTPSYPASFNLPNIISVAATDARDALAGFSNFGVRTVDLGAPGVSILSTMRNNAYSSLSGTSMASPHVAGVAAMLLSQSALSHSQIKSIILSNTDAKPALAGRTVSGGRLNAFRAVSSIAAPPVVVTISGIVSSIAVGQSTPLAASGGAAPYTWSSSNNAVATVNNAGLLRGVAPGTVTVTVRDVNGVQTTSSSISVTGLSITANSAALGVGQSLSFSASGGLPPYVWSSSNPGVADVNAATGVLTAYGVGSVIVRVTDNAQNSAQFGPITVSNLAVSPNAATLQVGNTRSFSLIGGLQPVSWRSNNTAVATINAATGLLTAVGAGNTTITATDANNVSVTSGTITVRNIVLGVPAASVLLGNTMQLTVSGGAAPYSWSSSNPAVATVSNNGLLTALATGSVTVTTTDASNLSVTSAPISVVDTTMTITPDTASVRRFNFQTFTVSGGSGSYSWAVTNPVAGTISAAGAFRASGTVGATTTVIVTDTANGATAETGTITVVGGGGMH